ncbi:hypothetical protein [Chitinivorax sp. B]|nr:hypothetical protein [Chitinivorax sp. B]
MRTYDKLIASIQASQGPESLRSTFGSAWVIGLPAWSALITDAQVT